MTSNGRSPNIAEIVLSELAQRPNEPRFLADLVTATGLNERQIQQAIHRLRAGNPYLADVVEVLVNGSVWRYVYDAPAPPTTPADEPAPAPTPTPRASRKSAQPTGFVVVGSLGEDVLLRDATGTTWRARPIDIQGAEW